MAQIMTLEMARGVKVDQDDAATTFEIKAFNRQSRVWTPALRLCHGRSAILCNFIP